MPSRIEDYALIGDCETCALRDSIMLITILIGVFATALTAGLVYSHVSTYRLSHFAWMSCCRKSNRWFGMG